ncbi:putative transmembrane protein At3g54730 [Brassica rapa]|uniref:putative transmembrane protein At3g54730 n=1 Tax=Brassica campestris TaxID=3711 RepID=UPI00142E2372|nr:putative transmembrane protein At3g54730 [Brassica rapa]
MATAPLPLRSRPPPDPPPCKFPPLGSFSPIEPPEPPDPPDAPALLRLLINLSSLSPRALAQTLDLDFPVSTSETKSAPLHHSDIVTCLCTIIAKYLVAARLPSPETPLLAYISLCGNFFPTIDSFMIVESTLYSAIECLLPATSYSAIECLFPVTSFYSAIECLLPITSWFQICLTFSGVEYLMLNCRFSAWLWFQIFIIITLMKPTSTSLLPLFLYRCCSCVARSAFGLEDCSTDDLFSVLFKGSASWCHIASAIVASITIVISALVAVPITSTSSLIVFFVFHGVIPLLKPSIVEIRRRFGNVSCLCIMIASIFVFLLAFSCSKVVSQYGFVIIFVNNSSSNGD